MGEVWRQKQSGKLFVKLFEAEDCTEHNPLDAIVVVYTSAGVNVPHYVCEKLEFLQRFDPVPRDTTVAELEARRPYFLPPHASQPDGQPQPPWPPKEERQSGGACNCAASDAWRCAVARNLSTVACHCRCHRADSRISGT